jgi:hypothetical protein
MFRIVSDIHSDKQKPLVPVWSVLCWLIVLKCDGDSFTAILASAGRLFRNVAGDYSKQTGAVNLTNYEARPVRVGNCF